MFQHNADEFALDSQHQSTLAEILGAFSYALDLTEGQPAGHSMRASWIGVRIAQQMGLGRQQRSDIFYAVLLKDLGCSVNAARVTELFVGNDRKLKREFKLLGPEAEDFGAFIVNRVGLGAPENVRDQAVQNLVENGGEFMCDITATRCSRGADIARQLRFSEDVATAIAHLDEHWDGSGLPLGVAGDAIHFGARIALLAQTVDVFWKAYGPEAAMEEVQKRSGTWFDPALVDEFLSLAKSRNFWEGLGSDHLPHELMATDAATLAIEVDEDYLDDIALAFGQVIDAKSPFTSGHSERVGEYTELVATRLGIEGDERRILRRAAILHDVGKLGVSSSILEKPGKLTDEEWIEMRKHSVHTFDILSKIGPMREMAVIAGGHHERLDGTGYPLGLDKQVIAIQTRIISICDIYDALTADRPYRAAMPVDKAMSIIKDDVGGAIDPQCYEALTAIVSEQKAA